MDLQNVVLGAEYSYFLYDRPQLEVFGQSLDASKAATDFDVDNKLGEDPTTLFDHFFFFLDTKEAVEPLQLPNEEGQLQPKSGKVPFWSELEEDIASAGGTVVDADDERQDICDIKALIENPRLIQVNVCFSLQADTRGFGRVRPVSSQSATKKVSSIIPFLHPPRVAQPIIQLLACPRISKEPRPRNFVKFSWVYDSIGACHQSMEQILQLQRWR